jgi:hypothetical protein
VFAALVRIVPTEMHVGLTNKESVRDVWDSICKIRVGMDGVKEVNAEWL